MPVLLPSSPADQPGGMGLALDQLVPSTPGWRDTLILDLRLNDAAVQRRLGFVTWASPAGRAGAIPLHALADGRTHRYVLPLGAHPDWQAGIRNLRLEFPASIDSEIQLLAAQLLPRPASAFDALLLRGLMPVLPRFPPWPHVVLLVAALLGAALALLWPWSQWRQRLALCALLLGGLSGGLTVVDQLTLLGTLTPRYAPLSESEASQRVPAYNEATSLNDALVAAAAVLPNGPVLIDGAQLEDYLVYRARYLLYPRRVDVRGSSNAPRTETEYVGLITRRGMPPPSAGWQPLSTPGAPIAIWSASDGPAPPLIPEPGAAAPLRLVLMLGLVGLAGWALAGLLGWSAALRLAAAWPLGVTLAAFWLFALALLRIPWSWLSVGVPLLLAALLPLVQIWRASPHPRLPRLEMHRWDSLVTGGMLLILLLLAAVSMQALLLPLSDQDTWRMWGLKSKGFFLDGELARVLTLYSDLDLHQPAYPPAQPLMQALGYLAMGGIGERLGKLIFPLWYASGLALTFLTIQLWTTRRSALAWTLLLATTPLLLDHATLGNADLSLAVALLLGATALCQWIALGDWRWLLGAALALAGAAWLKIDGLYLGAGMLLVAYLLGGWAQHGQARWQSLLLAAGWSFGIFLALAAVWQLYAGAIGLRMDTPGLELLQREGWGAVGRSLAVMGAELLFSYNNSAWGLLGGGYNALWLICLGAILANLKRLRRDPVLVFLVLALLGGLAFYVAIFVLRPLPSIERFIMHVAPIAVLAAARAVSGHKAA